MTDKKVDTNKEVEKEVEPARNVSHSDAGGEKDQESTLKKNTYIYAIGRRKEASATIRLYKNGKGNVKVNGREIGDYFKTSTLQYIVFAPLKAVGQDDKLDVEVKVLGGGTKGQAEAIRHGISRTLEKLNPNFRKALKKHGYLTRDPRVKERKKPGLRGARRKPQWAKR